jgi:hypothetical protein
MKPVLLGFFLVLILTAVGVSAALEDCPTCIFAYDDNGLADENPYAGCPTCVFNYDLNGKFMPAIPAGCGYCKVSSGTANTLGACSFCAFSSGVSTSAKVYRFPDGTAVPDENGRYLITDNSGNQYYSYGLPDKDGPYGYFADGTPIPDGYWNLEPPVANVQVPVKVQHTSADFINLFKRPDSMPRVSRLSQFLGR